MHHTRWRRCQILGHMAVLAASAGTTTRSTTPRHLGVCVLKSAAWVVAVVVVLITALLLLLLLLVTLWLLRVCKYWYSEW